MLSCFHTGVVLYENERRWIIFMKIMTPVFKCMVVIFFLFEDVELPKISERKSHSSSMVAILKIQFSSRDCCCKM